MDQNAAKRYSTALFEVASENRKVKVFQKQLKDLEYIFNENSDLMKVLNHPNIQLKDKKNIIEQAFKDKTDEEIIRLLFVLLKHGKINEFHNVCEHYNDNVYKYDGIKIAHVTTAVKMTGEEIQMFKDKLSHRYGCSMEIDNIVDPNVIGGVYLRVDDEVIDGTIRGNFEGMRKELLSQNVR